MCGIVGFWQTQSLWTEDDLLKARETLVHRGLDDRGIWMDLHGCIGLAHLRLSIIDLSNAGHQPMQSLSSHFRITYNEKIYNFKEVRSSLEERGHSFRSSSDTEVILKSFSEWGHSCLSRLRGMFSLPGFPRRLN